MRYVLNIFFLLALSSFAKAQVNVELLKISLDSVLSENNINDPGGSVHIEQGNQIIYSKSFGLADIKTKEKFSEYTVSNIGGISKTFIAYSILILQKQGKFSIEDPISLYFSDFNNKEIASSVKIKHLMMHTSGFIDLPLSKKDSLVSLKISDTQNFESLKHVNKLAFEPGSNFAYSDKAYSGLVLIIEKVSNLKFHEFVKQNILTPSGMSFTKVTENDFPNEKVAHAYLKLKKKYKEYDKGECPKMETISSAGIWTNIVDLRKYMYALKYNLFLDSLNIKLSEQFSSPMQGNYLNSNSHGLCWFANHANNIEYSSNQCAFSSTIIFFQEKDLTLICLSNNHKNYSQIILNQLKYFKIIQ
ncbi:MAG: serine hydrolase domain-containing protein [Bacteroidota bacterium]|nr:serine hydrolase domain-containing protein [Bacteroidota bacterium]